MADCVSLPNAVELVASTRLTAEYIARINGGKPQDYHPWKAADAIEQLIAENAKLKAERDAAAETIKTILQSSENIDLCMLCKYGNDSNAKCTEPNGREWCLKNAQWVGAE